MPSNPSPRHFPTTIDERLKAAAPHLGYEWAMLRGARHADWCRAPVSAVPPEMAAVVGLANQHGSTEDFLLHARLLYGFLTHAKAKRDFNDDVRAVDLLEDTGTDPADPRGKWRTRCGSVCRTLGDDLVRLNQRVTHLSYDRALLPKGWEVVRILAELEDAFREWAKHLTDARRARLKAEMDAVSPGSCPY